MRRCACRDALLVKHELNGDAACASVYLTDMGRLSSEPSAADMGHRELALVAAFASRYPDAPEPLCPGDADLSLLPGQLVHDWIAFPRPAAPDVWKSLRIRGWPAFEELLSLGPRMRSMAKSGRLVARIFCWPTRDVVWAPSEAHAILTGVCALCGAPSRSADTSALLPGCCEHRLPGAEGTVTACCPQHLDAVLDWHSQTCPVHATRAPAAPATAGDEQDPYETSRDDYVAFCSLAECSAREEGRAELEDGSGRRRSRFRRCARCKVAAYCCREHQAADWPHHKTVCKPSTS
eukprot:m51a1_g11597 hypothetical protein (293) ;mRNA; f:115416-116868